jgi:D-methionine transport system ATP-binding protein
VLDVFTRPQHATTRSLIEEVVPQALPQSVLTRIRALMTQEPAQDSQLLRLAFAGSGADQPLLSDVIRRHGIDVSIVHGQVDEVQGQPFGSLAVFARGARNKLDAAVAQLRGAGVFVEEVAHVG